MRRLRVQDTGTKEERRWQILQAAIPLFARNGFSATTVSEIARTANVSHGTVFLYFAAKEQLFEAAVREPLARIEAQSRVPDAPQKPLIDFLRQMVRIHFIAFSRQSNYLRLTQYVLGQADRFPELADALLAFGDRFRQQLVPIIKRGQQQGALARGPAEAIAHAYLAYIYGVALLTPPTSVGTREVLIEMGVRVFGPVASATHE